MIQIHAKGGEFQPGASPGAEARPGSSSEQKTEKAAGGVFKNIGNWFQHSALPALKKSWKWLVVGAATFVGVIATVALAVLFGKAAGSHSSKGRKKGKHPEPAFKKTEGLPKKAVAVSGKKPPGKLKPSQLNLKINPAVLLPGAKPATKPTANSDYALVNGPGSKDADLSYTAKLKSRPIGPAKRRLPSRFTKKGV